MSSEFHHFAKAVEARFRILANEGELYEVAAPDLFEVYLNLFPEGTNPIFRERTEHDCSCCKNFVRNLGNVVAIKGGKVITVWGELKGLPAPYDTVAAGMDIYVKAMQIAGIFRTKERTFGKQKNLELTTEGGTIQWNHFWGDVPGRFVHGAPQQEIGAIGTSIGVFKRGLEEIKLGALMEIVELIEANALYRGAEFSAAVQGFIKLVRDYHDLRKPADQSLFLWSNIRNRNALFRNTVIGTLAVDLSDGVELDHAVRSFEQKVAPMNYKRPTALITPKMIEEGLAKLRDMGLEGAINRRHAKLGDISVNNVLFVDNHVTGQLKDGLASLLMESAKTTAPDFKKAETISIANFLEASRGATSIELLLENRHMPNFVSLTAPVDPAAGNLFKWDNNFAWSYDGDATDSIKARVKAAGGNVKADLRFSLAWFNKDDLDLHVIQPNGVHLYFGNKDGKLDVDMNAWGTIVRNPVENVSFVGKAVLDGTYKVTVNQYNRRETVDTGFQLEMELFGDVQQFTYDKALAERQSVEVLQVEIRAGKIVRIKTNGLVGGTIAQEKWGLATQQLARINTLMASPNHWDDNAVGQKHWLFMLDGAQNPDPVRGIYNEFLKGELDAHRKVFEVLGNKTKAPYVREQLSGVGFTSARGDAASVVVTHGGARKSYNIQF